MNQKINQNKKFLIIVATHGDESFSVPITKNLKTKFSNKFDYIIGNPRALKEKKRFIDADLNRVAPGKEFSRLYEIKRAFMIMRKSKNYKFVLDIHGTVSQSSIFTIVTNPRPANINLAYSLPIDRVVIWGGRNNGRRTGPISRFVKCGVGIECGSKNSKETKNNLSDKLTQFLEDDAQNYEEMNKKELYQVFGEIKRGGINSQEKKRLKDFEEITINNQTFFPLLTKQQENKNIICYKMRKLNFYEKFSFPY